MNGFFLWAFGAFALAGAFLAALAAMVMGQGSFWLLAAMLLASGIYFLYVYRQRIREGNVATNVRMAENLMMLADSFQQVDDAYIARRPGEIVFYELSGVQLREHKSAGSDFNSNYFGGNVKIADGLSFSLGSSKGKLTTLPEESTAIDNGVATFTNKRVIFAGSNHSREWDLKNLIGLKVGIGGFEVAPAVSNRSKISSLAGGAELGITPGILFAIAVEYFESGEDAARQFARKTAQDIFDQADSLNR
jgi:hypothetical protein